MITIAVEGEADAPVARKVVLAAGLEPGVVYPQRGKGLLDLRLKSYNHAAGRMPWFVLRDLDSETCAPGVIARVLPVPARLMRFRLAVRKVEAWLLADHEAFGQFVGVSPSVVPSSPDELLDPKDAVVALARRSRKRTIRAGMVPQDGMTVRVGPGYTGLLIEFVMQHWRPAVAAQRSQSLASCIRALESLPP